MLFLLLGGDGGWLMITTPTTATTTTTTIANPEDHLTKPQPKINQPTNQPTNRPTTNKQRPYARSGDIYVAGGYGGGADYLSSVEMLPSGGGDEGRGWAALEGREGSMQVPRTGFGMAWGPDRGFYVAGALRVGLAWLGVVSC
jgi:hypothetical protein